MSAQILIESWWPAMQACTAGPERYGLDGVVVEPGHLAATNGHLLVVRKTEYSGRKRLVRVHGFNRPRRAENISVNLDDDGTWVASSNGWRRKAFLTSEGRAVCVEVNDTVEAVDWKAVVPKSRQTAIDYGSVGMNPVLLARIATALNDGERHFGLRVHHGECPLSPIFVEPLEKPEGRFGVLMPMRIH